MTISTKVFDFSASDRRPGAVLGPENWNEAFDPINKEFEALKPRGIGNAFESNALDTMYRDYADDPMPGVATATG